MCIPQKRKAFTMIELVFVIVVIGILSAVAIPRFAATRDDAVITSGIETVAAVRSAIATERQKRILRGEFSDMNLTTVGNNFTNILTYKVKSCTGSHCGGWETTGGTSTNPQFVFHGPTGDVTFTLVNNELNCTSGPCSDYQN